MEPGCGARRRRFSHRLQRQVSRHLVVLSSVEAVRPAARASTRPARDTADPTRAGRTSCRGRARARPAGECLSACPQRWCARGGSTYQRFNLAMRWLILRLPEFQREHPALETRIVTASTPAGNRPAMGVDVVVSGPARQPGWVGSRFLGEAYLPLLSPGLMKERPLRAPVDLARQTLLHAATRRQMWLRWLTAAGVPDLKPARDQVFEHFYFAIRLVRHRGAGGGNGPWRSPMPMNCARALRHADLNRRRHVAWPTRSRSNRSEQPGPGGLQPPSKWLSAPAALLKEWPNRYLSSTRSQRVSVQSAIESTLDADAPGRSLRASRCSRPRRRRAREPRRGPCRGLSHRAHGRRVGDQAGSPRARAWRQHLDLESNSMPRGVDTADLAVLVFQHRRGSRSRPSRRIVRCRHASADRPISAHRRARRSVPGAGRSSSASSGPGTPGRRSGH